MPTDSVTVAYIHDLEVTHSFHHSFMNMLLFDAGNNGRILAGGYIAERCTRSGSLPQARNQATEAFMVRDADWLFWIDTDMGFEPDTVERLLQVADPVERPVVGGLCFVQKETAPDGMSGFVTSPRVTILDWFDTPQGKRFAGRTNYPVNTVVKCAGTGTACVLIHRSVIEKMHAGFGASWYTQITGDDGKLLGEDVSFCVRAGALGIPIHVHTGVKTTHLKHLWLQESHFWDAAVPPPATEPTAVLVPAMRYSNAQRFMDSLRASSGVATVYAIAAPGEDEAEAAWSAAGAQVRMGIGSTFAERINTGYATTTEPWVFITGDDVLFRPGWLDHAQAVAGTGVHVVGTNDLGNPYVTAGEHATHMLIRRTYIDDVGASWDGPGNVCHEGYRHWFVDNEIVAAAKQRGAWAMALGSIVEHLHPMWGKAETDDVYRIGEASADVDRETFEKRLGDHAH